MVLRFLLLFLLSLLFHAEVQAQVPDSIHSVTDTLQKQTDSTGYDLPARIRYNTYFPLLINDIKLMATKPFHMSRNDWRSFGIFAAGTGALMLIDKPVQRLAVRLRNDSKTLRNVSSYVTRFGADYEIYLLAGIGSYGFIFRNIKMQTTFLLATQSYICSDILSGTFKGIFGRQRPNYIDPSTHEPQPRFHGPFQKPRDSTGHKISTTSFPSGHTIAAFSAATVYAMQYKNHALVPVLAYSAATLIGLSRITENKHWISDVFAGAAVGYISGRLVVNNYHRRAKQNFSNGKKGFLSFNFQYNNGVIMPGIIYQF